MISINLGKPIVWSEQAPERGRYAFVTDGQRTYYARVPSRVTLHQAIAFSRWDNRFPLGTRCRAQLMRHCGRGGKTVKKVLHTFFTVGEAL